MHTESLQRASMSILSPAVVEWLRLLVFVVVAFQGLAAMAGEVSGVGVGVAEERSLTGTIAFATVGRPQYAFDVYGVSLPADLAGGGYGRLLVDEERLTDGISVNSNGHIVEGDAKVDLLKWMTETAVGTPDSAESAAVLDAASKVEAEVLVHVSERDGKLSLYCSIFSSEWKNLPISHHADLLIRKWGETFKGSDHKSGKVLLSRRLSLGGSSPSPYLEDRPQIAGGNIVFVSTEQAPGVKRQGWTAVYSSSLTAPGAVVRLTPEGVSDYSPALSPSGKWVIAASLQGKGWTGEVEGLDVDLYVFDAADGSQRRLVTKNGGWPSWRDESTVFFHRQAEDGWWSVFRLSLSEDFLRGGYGIVESRVTPPGVHAFTPSASPTGEWIAVATRRPGSSIRHVEIFVLRSQKFIKLTENISPEKNHYNPFVSASSSKIVYHRCRGGESGVIPRLEPLESPIPGLALLRVEGIFPSFSHDGSMLAYVTGLTGGGIAVSSLNGEGQRMIFEGSVFGIAWDWKRKDVVYTSSGRAFSGESGDVHILSISNADTHDLSQGPPHYKQLTKDGSANNAFPSPSPDGKYLVFRSSRNGHKNLYIMDAVNGEDKGEIWQLTDGAWTDTMPSWSPSGEWIAFSSNRDNPTEGHFAGYLIRPDGTGLHRILSDGGRVNHLFFSPDGKSVVFTSDFAAVSAEPISLPNQFQPYGEIHISRIDGSAVQRLTHNAYEDGTPCWGPVFIDHSDLSAEQGDPINCSFDDVYWLAGPVTQSEVETVVKTADPKQSEADSVGKGTDPLPATWCPRGKLTR